MLQLTVCCDNQAICSGKVLTKAGDALATSVSETTKLRSQGEKAECRSPFVNVRNTTITFSATSILSSNVEGTDGHQAGAKAAGQYIDKIRQAS